MPSDIFNNSHLADIGAEYEYFVGAYFEIIHGCFVVYQGRLLGEEDGGIDLIAVNRHKTYLVQCKSRYRSLIHENTVNQLGGAALSFMQRFPEARNITPILFTTTDFDAQAQFAAEANNVQLHVMAYEKKTVGSRLVFFNNILSTESHHSPTYDLPLPEDYERFISKALSRCAPSSEGRHAAPEPEQIASQPNQIQPKPEQIIPYANQAAPVSLDDDTPSVSARDWFIHEHPLKFHNFLRFFVIPFNILSIILSSLAIDGAISPLVVICAYSIPVLFGVAFIAGSIKYEKWCYYVIHIYCWLNFAVMALLSFTGVMLIPAIICLIWTRCVTDYYKKRKPLFFPELLPDPPTSALTPTHDSISFVPYMRVCRALWFAFYIVLSGICAFALLVASRTTNVYLHAVLNSVYHSGFSTQSKFRRQRLWLYSPGRPVLIGLLATLGLTVFLAVFSANYENSQTPTPTASPTPTPTITAKPTPKITVSPSLKPTATPSQKPQRTVAPLPPHGTRRLHTIDLSKQAGTSSELSVVSLSSNEYYCIVLVDAKYPSQKICSLFLCPGYGVTFDIPPRDCLVYYTYGPADSWYGFTDYFGSQGRWVMSDEVFEFDTYAYELTLYKVEGGNWDTDYVDDDQVPFLN